MKKTFPVWNLKCHLAKFQFCRFHSRWNLPQWFWTILRSISAIPASIYGLHTAFLLSSRPCSVSRPKPAIKWAKTRVWHKCTWFSWNCLQTETDCVTHTATVQWRAGGPVRCIFSCEWRHRCTAAQFIHQEKSKDAMRKSIKQCA